MAEHNDSGKLAEQLASDWLVSKGYELLDTNYRFGHAEIDLILKHRGLLIFVEVKFRSGTGFGFAEEFVDATKRKLLIKAADHYIYEKDWHNDIRFDIIGVYRDRIQKINFRHFEDAFY
ncbi:YraN family protein [Algoriphagus sp. D3-2-R+10]|uniref:YraN family protein n=1 Tax=Algoriphagus aurantiacus TaxID=3103948 RepID=UPI002B3E6BE2|nr:YraN family protein [Algoriphagus sp. D3-2-R+10]MEB2776887.1 YraN family protein [Algoriphagus sp. D3-2-R+10]